MDPLDLDSFNKMILNLSEESSGQAASSNDNKTIEKTTCVYRDIIIIDQGGPNEEYQTNYFSNLLKDPEVKKYSKKLLESKNRAYVPVTRYSDGNVVYSADAKTRKLIENGLIKLPQYDLENKEGELLDLSDKRVTFKTISDENYAKLTSFANQYIDRIAKDHEKIKENHGSNASFYQERSFEKLPPTKATKKIVKLLMSSKFAEEFQKVIDKMDSSSLEKKREHNKIEKDKALEERIEYYEIKEKNREIRREDDDNFLEKHEEID